MKKNMARLALCLLAAGCAEDRLEYAGTDFEVQSAPPSPVSFEPDLIQIVAGVAVKVHATPHSSGELEYTEQDLLTLRATAPEVLEVYGTEDAREFVLVGAEAGQTCVEVTINRKREECIPVRVLAPVSE